MNTVQEGLAVEADAGCQCSTKGKTVPFDTPLGTRHLDQHCNQYLG